MEVAPDTPRITFPYGAIDALSTSIAWMGDAHDACEVVIATGETPDGPAVWRSGVTQTADSHINTPVLPANARLRAFVRLRRDSEWGSWSQGVDFRTASSPVIRLISPQHAGRARAPELRAVWSIEAEDEVTAQRVSIGGGAAIDVAPGEREAVVRVDEGVHTLTLEVTVDGSVHSRQSTFHVYNPAQESPANLHTLDLTYLQTVDVKDPREAADAWDILHIAAVLQGLANRHRPRLYINYTRVDPFWLEKIREPGGYVEHCTLVPLSGIEAAIERFAEVVKGAVVWDPEVPATSNVASTICGVEGLLPVRRDQVSGSIYDRLILNGPKLRVVHDLTGKFTGRGTIPDSDRDSTGSPKCDAYLWAKTRYLDTAQCNPRLIGYYCDAFWLRHPEDMSLDNVGLSNHDFVVARRGFFCDLNVWPDEAPRDEPDQRHGLDRETLVEVLVSCSKAARGSTIHFAGFTPWAMKYTTHGNAGGTHDAVPTEWETAHLASTCSAYMDADAIGRVGMANASVFAHCKLPDRLLQNPPPTRRDLEAKGYIDAEGRIAPLNFIYHYLGDYDSAAWLYSRLPELWNNPVRGQVPSGWAFNPNLVDRLPVAFDWCYRTAAPGDYFVAGDSGAGYVNPTDLLPPRDPSGLPSGAQAWIDHNVEYYRRLNYSITGFLINGFRGELTDESNALYRSFSGDGVMTQLQWMPRDRKHDHLLDEMVVAGMKQDITAPIDIVVEAMLKHGRPGETQFLGFRSILEGPDWIRTVNERVRAERPDCRFEPIDPYTYFYLLKHSLGGAIEMRATYTFDTAPAEASAGETLTITAGLRNDGWDTWHAAGDGAAKLHAGFTGRAEGVLVPLRHDVCPGEGVVVTFEIGAPESPGTHALSFEMVRGHDGYFGDANDMPWQAKVVIK